MHKTPFMIFLLESIIKSLDLKNCFFWSIFYWLGLSEYATDQNNSGGSEINSISTTFGEVCSKFSKNSRTLMYVISRAKMGKIKINKTENLSVYKREQKLLDLSEFTITTSDSKCIPVKDMVLYSTDSKTKL